jgi:polyhydroxyalkanoate synthesis regulator protein
VKVTIDIDCTPQEARAFLGLPNVEPMQDHLIQQLQEQLSKYLDGTDAEAMLKTWLPESIKGFSQLQEQFWRQFMTSGMGAGSSKSDDKEKS